jgi:RNA polymerase sigma factor (sigma-70 family)
VIHLDASPGQHRRVGICRIAGTLKDSLGKSISGFRAIAGDASLQTMDPSDGVSNVNVRLDASFRTTHWSAVLAARDQNSSQAQNALAELCRTYWYPLYVYVRRRGNNPTEAEDLTQGFFARLLEKNYIGDITPGMGRFRSFLLTALKHFLANQWDHAQTQKRGGGTIIFSLEDQDAETRYQFEPVDNVTPETLFEQRWALTVLEQVLARLRQEFVATEKAELFDQLKIFLSTDQPGCTYAEIGARTGLKEGTVKVAVHRLRRRYGELLRAEISNTVNNPQEVEDEVRHLVSVLSKN